MEAIINSRAGGVCRMTLHGEVIQRQLRKFNDPLAAEGGETYRQKVLCDMSGTKLLDSAGVSWLLVAHKRCREQGGRFVLHSIPQLVMNVLLVLRLNLVFDIADNEASALKLANQPLPQEQRGEISYKPELADHEQPAEEDESKATNDE